MADHHDNDTYVRGEMDIRQEISTFEMFVNMTKWGSYTLAVALTFVVVLTCTKLGFISALSLALVVAAVGWFLLKKKAH